MAISANEFRDTVRDRLLGLLWRQWSAIGVAGYSEVPETRVVDPEPLLLLTLTVGRHDARLYDAVLEWLDLNADYLNVQRLQNLAPSFGPHAQAGLGAIAERLGAQVRGRAQVAQAGGSFRLGCRGGAFLPARWTSDADTRQS